MSHFASEKYFIISMRRDSGPEQLYIGDQLDNDGDFLCACNGVSRQFEGESVELVFRTRPKCTILSAFPAISVGICLLHILKIYGFEPIEGPVYAKKSRILVKTHRSIYVRSKDAVLLRGGIGSKYRLCPDCGMMWNRVAGEGVLAIPRCFVLGKHVLFIDARSQLAVSEEVAEAIRDAQIDGIRLDEIPLVDSPKDGLTLPGDPDWASIDPSFVPDEKNDWESPW